MPGPCNRRKPKARGKKQKGKGCDDSVAQAQTSVVTNEWVAYNATYQSPEPQSDGPGTNSTPSSPYLKTPSPELFDMSNLEKEIFTLEDEVSSEIEKALFEEPFIHDPGNGPRVRNASAFMGSFFAQPPALQDPLCAEFAQEEVLQMLRTILPEETALILWYNKSRSHGRVCPSCQRLYRLGDTLPDLMDKEPTKSTYTSPQLLREQQISGLCSPVCFIIASFNYPEAIKSTWGRMAHEMDDESWDLLNETSRSAYESETCQALGLLMRMTRLHDLGLAQLCFDDDEEFLLQGAEIDTVSGGHEPVSVS